MLTEMLKKNKQFQSLPLDKQDLIARLASAFQEDFQYLYLSPEELQNETNIGNRNQWQELLSLDITGQYIKQQMGQQIQVSQRKAIQSLQAQALLGNTQAAKQIVELSGLLTQSDQNKVVILHQIERPKTERVQ
jgi:chromosome condensin MukBEF MukE localization factor